MWMEKENGAVGTLRQELIRRPVLALYNPEVKTEVHTDANINGLAGILVQEQTDKTLRPVIYYSRQTTRRMTRKYITVCVTL